VFRPISRIAIAVTALPALLVAGSLVAAPTDSLASGSAALAWTDLTGRSYNQADIARNKATVFVFTSLECPIAVRYVPRLAQLAKEYSVKDVAFFLVNANVADDAASLAKWGKERKLTLPLVKDDGTKLADRLAVNATPEAAVVTPDGVVVYRGGIDDNPDDTRVFREVAGIIQSQLREYDFLARYAGDEFVALVQEVVGVQVEDLCMRIENAV